MENVNVIRASSLCNAMYYDEVLCLCRLIHHSRESQKHVPWAHMRPLETYTTLSHVKLPHLVKSKEKTFLCVRK